MASKMKTQIPKQKSSGLGNQQATGQKSKAVIQEQGQIPAVTGKSKSSTTTKAFKMTGGTKIDPNSGFKMSKKSSTTGMKLKVKNPSSTGLKLKSKYPSSTVVKRKNPSSTGVKRKTPSTTGLKSKHPNATAVKRKNPSSTGLLKSKYPSSTVLKHKNPSSSGVKRTNPSSTGLKARHHNLKNLHLKAKNLNSKAKSIDLPNSNMSFRLPKANSVAVNGSLVDGSTQNRSLSKEHVPQFHWRGTPSFDPRTNPTSDSTVSEPPLPIQDLPPLLLLPERVRSKILGYLTLQERRSGQEVCRTFRNEIRNYVGIGTRINDSTRGGLVFMRDVAITSIFVCTYKFPAFPPSEVIGNASRVEQLTFTEPIAYQHIDAFLLKCRRIQGLFFEAPPLDVAPPQYKVYMTDCFMKIPQTYEWRSMDVITKCPVLLEYLHTLSITIPGNRGASLLARMLQLVNAPGLRQLAIQIGGVHDMVNSGSFHMRLFPFIVKHKTLKRILISTVARDETNNKLEDKLLGFTKARMSAIGSTMQLTELTLTESQVPFQNWVIFLKEQQSLCVYQVLHLLPLSVHRFNIKRNASTLRVLNIHAEPEHFDLSPVGKCSCLEELYICYDTYSRERSTLSNLSALPGSIRVLALKGCSFNVPELFRLIETLQSLRSLGIVSNGVDTDIELRHAHFMYLLRRRKLDELLILGYTTTPFEMEHFPKYLNSKKIRRLGIRNGIHIPHQDLERRRWTSGPFSFILLNTWMHPQPFFNNRP